MVIVIAGSFTGGGIATGAVHTISALALPAGQAGSAVFLFINTGAVIGEFIAFASAGKSRCAVRSFAINITVTPGAALGDNGAVLTAHNAAGVTFIIGRAIIITAALLHKKAGAGAIFIAAQRIVHILLIFAGKDALITLTAVIQAVYHRAAGTLFARHITGRADAVALRITAIAVDTKEAGGTFNIDAVTNFSLLM